MRYQVKLEHDGKWIDCSKSTLQILLKRKGYYSLRFSVDGGTWLEDVNSDYFNPEEYFNPDQLMYHHNINSIRRSHNSFFLTIFIIGTAFGTLIGMTLVSLIQTL